MAAMIPEVVGSEITSPLHGRSARSPTWTSTTAHGQRAWRLGSVDSTRRAQPTTGGRRRVRSTASSSPWSVGRRPIDEVLARCAGARPRGRVGPDLRGACRSVQAEALARRGDALTRSTSSLAEGHRGQFGVAIPIAIVVRASVIGLGSWAIPSPRSERSHHSGLMGPADVHEIGLGQGFPCRHALRAGSSGGGSVARRRGACIGLCSIGAL